MLLIIKAIKVVDEAMDLHISIVTRKSALIMAEMDTPFMHVITSMDFGDDSKSCKRVLE